jgi:ligand-binding SRPBCC domain-containing protein
MDTRAVPPGATADGAVFVYQSIVPASAGDVFRWHQRPDALLDLTPLRRWMRIERQEGGLRDGARITFSLGLGPVRVRWEARHYGYVDGTQFCDEQVRGPFRVWRHCHRVVPVGVGHSLYVDRVEYALPGGPLAQGMVRPLLRRLFTWRHQIVRRAFVEAGARQGDSRRGADPPGLRDAS